MRITIFAAGSRGDIQPCLLLGRELQRQGFSVCLAAPENFSTLAQGLAFFPLRGDIQQIMAGQTGRAFMESGGRNPVAQIRAMRRMIGPVALQMATGLLEASREGDALISLAVFAPLARTIAEIHRIPLILLEPTPLLPSRAFPAPGWPIQQNLGALHNRLSGFAMLALIWQWYRPFANQFRAGNGLPPLSAGSFSQILHSTPLLGAYSPHVVPPPSDWPQSVRITGYWFPAAPEAWQPPPALEEFLQAGDPPVYVGFGSMSGQNPERLAALVLQSLAETGRRGLILTGWGGMRALTVPRDIFVIDSAPHSWLFPHMAAVVHHGGAGTTAEGLRAGIPSIVLPFMMDQPFWGERVHALGAGPRPVPIQKLTAGRLSHAISQALTSESIHSSAARLGAAIRSEDGLPVAVDSVREFLGG